VRFENTKCECGHQNAVGTVLCEACGKPLFEGDEVDSVLEMRYDGVARKSQKASPSWIDRIWNFYSSVKVAVILIVITLIGASLGTIYPQESSFLSIDPTQYYKSTYGTLGQIYYMLGLSHTYESWWFITLLVMIGASLVICSIDRVLPLYRALHRQKIRKHVQFISRQRIVYEGSINQDAEAWLDNMSNVLKKKGYRVIKDNEALLAEKNRFSRWGPYINHIGLILFLLAILARSIPGWHYDYYDGFPQGEAREIPGTPYYLQNDKFTVEYYGEEDMPEQFVKEGRVIPKLFETKATLFKCVDKCGDARVKPVLEQVAQHNIQLNSPLEYEGLMVYQSDFESRLVAVSPVLSNVDTGEVYGKFELRVQNTATEFQAGSYSLKLTGKYLDFAIGKNGELTTKSQNPNAPAFSFLIKGPNLPSEGLPYLYFALPKDKDQFHQDDINAKLRESLGSGSMPNLRIGLESMKDIIYTNSISYMTVRKETALPLIWIGAGISMIGLVMGFYWQHRRIWLRIDGNRLLLGAHTNKNWYGIRNEVASALGAVHVEVDAKSIDRGGNKA